MESRCVARWLRVAPRKMRLVADLVRGKNVNEAISILKFTPKAGALPTLKAMQSAVSNIVNREDVRNVNPDSLFVKTIFVDEGPTLKRFMPRAMGRATPIRKRMSHLTVIVSTPEGETVVAAPAPEKKSKAVRETKPEATAAKKSGGKRAKKTTE